MSARMRILTWLIVVATACPAVAVDSNKPAPKIAYTNKSLVTVPIRIADNDRPKIKAIKFYVKPPQGNWLLYETGNAQTEKFSFQAPADGEYWFAFPTVEDGRANDIKVDQLMPAIVVVVDTQ